jgi:MFS transporter, FSR family, fosmidomycin resistance protein
VGPSTTSPVRPVPSAEAAAVLRAPTTEALPDAARARFSSTVAIHGVVDFFSALIIPILTVLLGHLHLTAGQDAGIIALGSITSGLIQPIVAWTSDRFDTRWLGTLGLAAAAIAIGSVGFVSPKPLFGVISGYQQLLIIQAVGSAGIGAFHPVAAAAVGRLSGRRRSLGVSVFYVAGMIGGIAGSITSPYWVKWFGLPALAWFIAPGLVAALVLGWAIHGIAHRAAGARDRHAALTEEERAARWTAVGLLYAGNVLRFTANMALIQLVIRWSEAEALRRAGAAALTPDLRTAASTLNGAIQAAMAVGMAIGGLAAGFTLPARHEKTALIIVPIVGAIGVAAFPLAGETSAGVGPLMVTVIAFVLAMFGGLGYGGVIPVTISLAQRLLPHRTSLASGLMMGGAWMVAAVGPFAARALNDRFGLGLSFLAVAGLLVVAGLLAIPLKGSLVFQSDEA